MTAETFATTHYGADAEVERFSLDGVELDNEGTLTLTASVHVSTPLSLLRIGFAIADITDGYNPPTTTKESGMESPDRTVEQDEVQGDVVQGDKIEHDLMPGFVMKVQEVRPCETDGARPEPHESYKITDPEGNVVGVGGTASPPPALPRANLHVPDGQPVIPALQAEPARLVQPRGLAVVQKPAWLLALSARSPA